MIRLIQNQCKCLFYMSANVIFVGKDNGTREVSKKVTVIIKDVLLINSCTISYFNRPMCMLVCSIISYAGQWCRIILAYSSCPT